MNLTNIRQFGRFLLVLTVLLLPLHIEAISQSRGKLHNGPARCSRIAKGQDFLFIEFEQRSRPENDSHDAILLRLHNNSTCAVLITSGNAEKFQKPLPENPTVMQRLKREIEYELPDDVLVPEVQYRYNANGRERNAIGGDSFFGFYLLPKRSILIEVAIEHLGRLGAGNLIAVPFQYDWEAEDQSGNIYPSVENRVLFWTDSLPPEVKARIKEVLSKKITNGS